MSKWFKMGRFIILCLVAACIGKLLADNIAAQQIALPDHECRTWVCTGTVDGYIQGTNIPVKCQLNNFNAVNACFTASSKTCTYDPNALGLCPGTVPPGEQLAGSPCEARYYNCK